jgi:hypothetical protein
MAGFVGSITDQGFALGRGIQRRIREFFFLKTLNRRHPTAFVFFVAKATFLLLLLASLQSPSLIT